AAFLLLSWRRGWRPVWTMLCGFVLLLAPSLGSIRFMGAIAADRFAYTPMVLLILLGADGLRRLWRHAHSAAGRAPPAGSGPRPAAWAATGAAVLILGLFTARTIAQQAVWQNTRTYYAAIRERFPNHPEGYFGLGLAYLAEHDEWLAGST